MTPILLWFRRDLRLHDQPALHHAVATGQPLIPVFIHAPDEESPWAPGGASKWWLHHSLEALSHDLAKRGTPLVLRCGSSVSVLLDLIQVTGARRIFCNALPEPHLRKRDAALAATLRKRGIEVEMFGDAHLLHHPDHALNRQGKPYQVFTPFYKARLADPAPSRPYPQPQRWMPWQDARADGGLNRMPLAALNLLPKRPWAERFPEAGKPGEKGAADRLREFLKHAASGYERDRDYPAREGVSRLSPHLHFGELGPREAWWAVEAANAKGGLAPWLRQLWWREFAHHLLHHFPLTPEKPLRPVFAKFPWKRDAKALHAWQRGRTGYPLVDAGMRELWATGTMHNRVRMVAGSFLVKHLLLPWQEGARWFFDTLLDADLANNTMGWQWVAGCGADAAPYFRIFHPVTQSERFDAEGQYIRRWVPELARLPATLIHKPWEASPLDLAEAGVSLGKDYPHPIVDHAFARNRALTAYREMMTFKP